MSTGKEALKKAIKLAGGQSALAKKIRKNQPYISMALNQFKKVPAEIVLKIEAAVGGAVTRYDLRPDLYPRE